MVNPEKRLSMALVNLLSNTKELCLPLCCHINSDVPAKSSYFHDKFLISFQLRSLNILMKNNTI